MADGFPLRSLAEVTVATAGTRVQVNSGTSLLCFSALITADDNNTGNMFVGDINVSSTRFAKRLAAGESVVVGIWSPVPQFELSSVWLDAATNGDGCQVHFI